MTTSFPHGQATRLSPDSIASRSFAIIDQKIPEPRPFQGHAWEVARRLIHATGDLSLVNDLVLPEAAVEKGIKALRLGAPVFTDSRMARAGIPARRLQPLGGTVQCLLDQPGVMGAAIRAGITRSRAAMLMSATKLVGAVVVIGKAPASLSTLLDMLDDMPSIGCCPALIIGMPAGFVNAAESKALLAESPWTMLTIRGSKGGSLLAAAALNALAEIAWRETQPKKGVRVL